MTDKKSILVIDDDPDIRYFCESVLTEAGYAVRSAESGAEGLASARNEPPDLVILDIVMEKINAGYAVADTLGPGVPILMMSSILNESDVLFDAAEHPFRELLRKPVDAATLLAKVKKLIG